MHMLSQHGLIQDGVLDSALQLAGYLAGLALLALQALSVARIVCACVLVGGGVLWCISCITVP